jgi:hypothetical protein
LKKDRTRVWGFVQADAISASKNAAETRPIVPIKPGLATIDIA